MTSSPTVNVAIATFRRPDRLRRALESLASAQAGAPDGWTLGVTVVDDDPASSAADVAGSFAERFPLGCDYVHVGSRNISVARNTGIEASLDKGVGWAASIDDDVVVPADWMVHCVATLERGSYEAVTGPLLKDFGAGPAWLREQPFDQMGITAGQDGEPTAMCATGNNWVATSFLRARPGLRFDRELGRTGGEDVDFFHRAVADGLRAGYSLGSGVVEREPPERCTMRYQLRRAYWLGISESLTGRRLRLVSRRRLLARALRRAATRGSRQLPDHALERRGLRYTAAVLAQCAGMVVGVLGGRLEHK